MVGTVDRVKQLKRWAIGGSLVFIAAVLFYKVRNPGFDLVNFIKWIGGGGAVLGILMYGWSKISKKLNPDKPASASDKLPPAITLMQARELMRQALADPMYMDEFDLSRMEKEVVEEVGKPASKVYLVVGWGKYEPKKHYAIGINMHYPDTMRSMLVDPTDYEITKMKNGLAVYPVEEIPIKRTLAENPILGTRVLTEEPQAKPEEKDNKKEDELDKK